MSNPKPRGRKYSEMIRKGSNVILTQMKKIDKSSENIPDETLFTLNDSHGIPPDMVITLAIKAGWKNVKLRTGFSAEMAERHALMAKQAAKSIKETNFIQIPENLPTTKSLYYDDVQQREFDSSVLFCGSLDGDDVPDEATHGIILDRTCFYPGRWWTRRRPWYWQRTRFIGEFWILENWRSYSPSGKW